MHTAHLIDDDTGKEIASMYFNIVPRQGEYILSGKNMYFVKWVVYGPTSDKIQIVVEPGYPVTRKRFI